MSLGAAEDPFQLAIVAQPVRRAEVHVLAVPFASILTEGRGEIKSCGPFPDNRLFPTIPKGLDWTCFFDGGQDR